MKKNRVRAAIACAFLAVAGCSAQTTEADLGRVANETAAVEAGCQSAAPLAGQALAIPTVGPFVAAGVAVVCATDVAINQAASDPSTAAWLGQQSQMLKDALAKAPASAPVKP